MPTTILLVDDHPVVRCGLATTLTSQGQFKVVGEASNSLEAMTLCAQLSPKVVILDLSLPDQDGLHALKEMHRTYPSVHILALAHHDPQVMLQRALNAGATGVLFKDAALKDIVLAVQSVSTGATWPTNVSGYDIAPSTVACLSDRQLQIFSMVGEGFATRQIAERLGLSSKTIEAHKESIKLRLGINNAVDLLRLAMSFQTK